jgi:hypothetical protein
VRLGVCFDVFISEWFCEHFVSIPVSSGRIYISSPLSQ